jgi:hypothetical protein
MSRPPATASSRRDPTALLCERCGYRIDGLPGDHNCPECGLPVTHSTVDSIRGLTCWEHDQNPIAFLRTSLAICGRPSRFFRKLRTRPDQRPLRAGRTFAAYHVAGSSGIIATATVGHYGLVLDLGPWILWPMAWLVILAAVVLSVELLMRIAGWLTTKEAAWRDMRLPKPVVERTLDYQVACVSAAALLPLTVVAGYRLTGGVLGHAGFVGYLVTLSGVTVIGAVYFFLTFWAAMRAVRYANV